MANTSIPKKVERFVRHPHWPVSGYLHSTAEAA